MSEEHNAPQLAPKGRGYEVWFLTFTDPGSGRGYWIRSTYHGGSRGRQSAGSWFAQFDPVDLASTFGIHAGAKTWSMPSGGFDRPASRLWINLWRPSRIARLGKKAFAPCMWNSPARY